MIPKIASGNDFTGVLRYAAGKGFLLYTNMLTGEDRYGPGDLGSNMQLYARCRPDVQLPVLHISLRLPRQDAIGLTDADFLSLARHFMRKIEIHEDRHQFAVYMHSPDHVHLVINRVDIDRKAWRDSYSHLRAMSACRELEAEFNLTPVNPVFNMFSLKLTREEVAMERRTARPSLKRIIFDAIDETIPFCGSIEDMVSLLAGKGIVMAVNPGRGISFRCGGIAFAGGSIARCCTLPYLEKRLVARPLREDLNEHRNVVVMPLESVRGYSDTETVAPVKSPRDSKGLEDRIHRAGWTHGKHRHRGV